MSANMVTSRITLHINHVCTREPRATFTQKSHFTWTSTKEVEMVSAVSHPFQSVVISVSKV